MYIVNIYICRVYMYLCVPYCLVFQSLPTSNQWYNSISVVYIVQWVNAARHAVAKVSKSFQAEQCSSKHWLGSTNGHPTPSNRSGIYIRRNILLKWLTKSTLSSNHGPVGSRDVPMFTCHLILTNSHIKPHKYTKTKILELHPLAKTDFQVRSNCSRTRNKYIRGE